MDEQLKLLEVCKRRIAFKDVWTRLVADNIDPRVIFDRSEKDASLDEKIKSINAVRDGIKKYISSLQSDDSELFKTRQILRQFSKILIAVLVKEFEMLGEWEGLTMKTLDEKLKQYVEQNSDEITKQYLKDEERKKKMREKLNKKKEQTQGTVITIAKTIGSLEALTHRPRNGDEKRSRVVCGFSYELNSFDFA